MTYNNTAYLKNQELLPCYQMHIFKNISNKMYILNTLERLIVGKVGAGSGEWI